MTAQVGGCAGGQDVDDVAGRSAGVDRHAAGVGVFVIDVGGSETVDLAPRVGVAFGVVWVGAEGAQRRGAGRGVGRVIDDEEVVIGRVLEVQGSCDALDAAGSADIDCGGGMANQVGGHTGAQYVDDVGGGVAGVDRHAGGVDVFVVDVARGQAADD